MSNLKPSMVGLDQGLNLQTAKIVAPAGSVLDTLNYEQVDFQGQKRIDGFYRYDGSVGAGLYEFYVLTVTGGTPYAVGDILATTDGIFGKVLSEAAGVIHFAVLNLLNLPEATSLVYSVTPAGNTNERVTISLVLGKDSGLTDDEHYTLLLEYNNIIRGMAEELPGPVAGLHWFRDRLLAVASVTFVSLDGTTPQIYPEDVLVSTAGTARVLDSFILADTRAVFLDAMNPDDWTVEGLAVTRDAVSVGAVANGYQTLPVGWEIASFFESRTEQQVIDEDAEEASFDFGWRFIPLGWKVNFENGLTLYGSLPSLNQNVEGIGVQGPTSIAGNNGRPLLVSQKVSITNGPTQVNGWKSTTSRDSYVIDEQDLIDIDTDYLYADAYITWTQNGTTVLPGYSVGNLEEYPATNTVEVEI